MNETILYGKDEILADTALPFLSASRLQRYLTCPESYRLHYLEGYRPKVDDAGLVFGAVLHVALAHFFRSGADPVQTFLTYWEALKETRLQYGLRESWEDFKSKGKLLLEKFLAEGAKKIGKVYAVEKSFEFHLSNMSVPFVGIIDLVAEVDGVRTVIDFKTSASRYQPHEVILSDQLTAYRLAEPDAQQVAFCIFVKTKSPRIEWFFAQREADDLSEFLEKVSYSAGEIEEGHFFKRPGRHCGSCEFLPICVRDEKAVKETLVRLPRFPERMEAGDERETVSRKMH